MIHGLVTGDDDDIDVLDAAVISDPALHRCDSSEASCPSEGPEHGHGLGRSSERSGDSSGEAAGRQVVGESLARGGERAVRPVGPVASRRSSPGRRGPAERPRRAPPWTRMPTRRAAAAVPSDGGLGEATPGPARRRSRRCSSLSPPEESAQLTSFAGIELLDEVSQRRGRVGGGGERSSHPLGHMLLSRPDRLIGERTTERVAPRSPFFQSRTRMVITVV